ERSCEANAARGRGVPGKYEIPLGPRPKEPWRLATTPSAIRIAANKIAVPESGMVPTALARRARLRHRVKELLGSCSFRVRARSPISALQFPPRWGFFLNADRLDGF